MRKTFAGIILATIAALGLIGGLAFGLSDPVTTQPFNNIYVTRIGGQGTINYDFSPTVSCKIESVYVSLGSVGGANSMTFTVDSGTSTSYDTVLLTQDMTSIQYKIWPTDSSRIYLDDLDQLDIDWTSNSTTRTYGIQIHWSRP